MPDDLRQSAVCSATRCVHSVSSINIILHLNVSIELNVLSALRFTDVNLVSRYFCISRHLCCSVQIVRYGPTLSTMIHVKSYMFVHSLFLIPILPHHVVCL